MSTTSKENILRKKLKEIHYPSEDTSRFMDSVIMSLWNEGFDLDNIQHEIQILATVEKNRYAMRNTMDILSDQYNDIEDMKQRMPLCPVNDQGRRYLTNVPWSYLKWAVMRGKLGMRI